MSKPIDIKKEIYENMKARGFDLKMDSETQKVIEEEKLKKCINNLMKTHMPNVKANLTGRKEKELKTNDAPEIEIEKKQFTDNESRVYGKEFMVNKIKEVYG